MGIASILGLETAGPLINDIQVDVSINETHTLTATPTDSPIESGGNVSDHVKVDPRTLEMEGMVSDFPVDVLKAINGESAFDRYIALDLFFDNADVFEIVTELRSYPAMVCTRFSVPRDKSTGGAVMFSASFREIQYAFADGAVIPSAVDAPTVAPKADVGAKATPEETLPQANETMLRQISPSASDALTAVNGWFQ